jgi:multidrug resistance efflux pump
MVISEKEITDIQIGQRVVLRARGYPDLDFHGSVTSIATSAQSSSDPGGQTPTTTAFPSVADAGNKTVLVTTQIDNAPGCSSRK